MTARLASVTVYPVKSTAGRRRTEAAVEPLGLVGDRRWMAVGPDGECVTARRDRALLSIVATPTESGLRLESRCSDRPPIEVTDPTGPPIEVSVHGKPLHGIPAATAASTWVGHLIGRDDVRLVRLGEPRPLNPARSRPDDRTAFADGYPVTLASTASLRRLQDWVVETALDRGEEPTRIAMDRFRPNLVVDGDLAAFVEDGWQEVCVGDVTFDVAKCIDRCVLTTIEPASLDSGPEPIRSLARHHAWDGATWFGIQLIPRSAGTVRIGDSVSALSR
ncbi:MAG: MOSC domain-containing protein [Dermatophilaceae bacterium]|nr:MOSC domain-containing protein [Intrasporangiaceae bacterium]